MFLCVERDSRGADTAEFGLVRAHVRLLPPRDIDPARDHVAHPEGDHVRRVLP